MNNSFFTKSLNPELIQSRIKALENGNVGFYSVGLYPASLAYNCAMQTAGVSLLLAPRPERELLGAFPEGSLDGMDDAHVASVIPQEGDIIKISSIRPLSKNKRWQVSEIIRKKKKLG